MMVAPESRSRRSRVVSKGSEVGPWWTAMKMMSDRDISMSREERRAPTLWNDICLGVRMSLTQILAPSLLSRFPSS